MLKKVATGVVAGVLAGLVLVTLASGIASAQGGDSDSGVTVELGGVSLTLDCDSGASSEIYRVSALVALDVDGRVFGLRHDADARSPAFALNSVSAVDLSEMKLIAEFEETAVMALEGPAGTRSIAVHASKIGSHWVVTDGFFCSEDDIARAR